MEGGFVGGFEEEGRGEAGVEGFFPSGGAEAPAVAGFESGETVFGGGGGEVVAAGLAEGEEFFGDLGAYGVAAGVCGTGGAGAVAEEAGERVEAAGFEFGAENVFGHRDREVGRWEGEK